MFKQIHSLKILGQLEFEATRSQFVLNIIYLFIGMISAAERLGMS